MRKIKSTATGIKVAADHFLNYKKSNPLTTKSPKAETVLLKLTKTM